ncbi:hypothetical protein LCGC14_2869720, partial [marine sediment metagenome]
DEACYTALYVKALVANAQGRQAEAIKAIGVLVAKWPAYARPRLNQGEILLAAGRRSGAVRAFRAGTRATVCPSGRDRSFKAELNYRVASIYADLTRRAVERNRSAAIGYKRKYHDAILRCIKLDPRHQAGRKLFLEMGGRFIQRPRR